METGDDTTHPITQIGKVPLSMQDDASPSSLCDPERVQRVGFAKMVRNLVPLPASSTKRGRGVVLEALGLDEEEIKLFGHEPAFKTNTSWLKLILHAFGVGTSHSLIRTLRSSSP